MNTESLLYQIAREAAEKWDLWVLAAVKCRLRADDKVELENIIRSAIERATPKAFQDGVDSMRTGMASGEGTEQQAAQTRSEQQEWWPEGCPVTPWDMSSRDMLMHLSPFHNAALAAKQEEVNEARKETVFWAGEGQENRPEMIEWQKLSQKKRPSKAEVKRMGEIARQIEAENMDLPELQNALTAEREKVTLAVQAARIANKNLATERQRRKEISKRYCLAVEAHIETKQQLLSALAANKKAVSLLNCQPFPSGYEIRELLVTVDLSLLHEHDAEVRKPLVEVMFNLRERIEHSLTGSLDKDVEFELTEYLKALDDALTRVKENA